MGTNGGTQWATWANGKRLLVMLVALCVLQLPTGGDGRHCCARLGVQTDWSLHAESPSSKTKTSSRTENYSGAPRKNLCCCGFQDSEYQS